MSKMKSLFALTALFGMMASTTMVEPRRHTLVEPTPQRRPSRRTIPPPPVGDRHPAPKGCVQELLTITLKIHGHELTHTVRLVYQNEKGRAKKVKAISTAMQRWASQITKDELDEAIRKQEAQQS